MVSIRQHTKKLIFVLCLSVGITLLFREIRTLCNGQISVSHPSGFYNDSFRLEIDTGLLYDVYYTLDGSEPTTDSLRYEHGTPIEITDASSNQNRDVAQINPYTEQPELLPENLCNPDLYHSAPAQPADKCTVVRAAPFFMGKQVSDSVCCVYFVGWQNRADYQNSYIVSIVADPDDLFGSEKGIMVGGQTMETYLEKAEAGKLSDKELALDPLWWPANYHESGMDWERVVNISVFNQNREKEMDQRCGIRIHGGVSRGLPLKSLRCYARKEYSGLDFFGVNWFGEGIQPSKFTLYSGGNEYLFNIKDHMISHLSQELAVSTMDFIPCALFINGEFWGFYQISEHYNKKYIADHFSVHENNVLMIKADEVAEGQLKDIRLYESMVDYITNSDMTDDAHYRTACDLIDMDSYIDYYAIQTYIARTVDWPGANFALWRTVEQEESVYGDGKWRWMLFDANSRGMASDSYTCLEDDTLYHVLDSDEMFASLFRNQKFQEKFASRMLYIGSEILAPEKCSAFMDAFFTDFYGLHQSTNIRLNHKTMETRLETYRENLNRFFAERYGIVCQQLEQHLDPIVFSALKTNR